MWKDDLPPNRATTCDEANLAGSKAQEANWSYGSQVCLNAQEQTSQAQGGPNEQSWAGDSAYAPWNRPHVCPNCGYCPTCGRPGGYGIVPNYPTPYYFPDPWWYPMQMMQTWRSTGWEENQSPFH